MLFWCLETDGGKEYIVRQLSTANQIMKISSPPPALSIARANSLDTQLPYPREWFASTSLSDRTVTYRSPIGAIGARVVQLRVVILI